MRGKSFPFYQDWVIIFGKDRATGENSETYVDAVNGLFAIEREKYPVSPYTATSNSAYTHYPSDTESDVKSTKKSHSVSSPPKKESRPKKRIKQDDAVESVMVDNMSSFLVKIEEHMGDLVTKLSTGAQATEMRKKILDLLLPIETLTIDEKLQVAGFVYEKKKDLDIIFNIGVEHRAKMCRLILDGKYAL